MFKRSVKIVEFDSFKLLCRNSLKKRNSTGIYRRVSESFSRSKKSRLIIIRPTAYKYTSTQVCSTRDFDVHFISKRHLPSGLMGYSLPSFELLFKGMMGAYEENDNNVPFFLPFSCCVKESERRAEKKKRVRLGCSQQDLNVPRR